MRKGPLACALSTVLACVAANAREARATDCGAALTSPCIDSDTFWPHTGPTRFVAVGSAETTARGQFGVGLVGAYQSRPLVLHVGSPGLVGGVVGSDQYVVNDQVNGTFLFDYGITDRLSAGLALPITFAQGGSGAAALTGGDALKDTALRDLRLGLAYAIVPHLRASPDVPSSSAIAKKNVWGLVARFELAAPTGDHDQFAGNRGAVWVPSIAGDYRRGRWFAGAEIGARLRETSEFVGARIGTQGLIGLGVGFDILQKERLSIAAEARALPTFAEQHDAVPTATGLESRPNGKHVMPAEWMLSLRSAPIAGGDFSIQLGGGGAIPTASDPAPTVPRFRFVLGVRYEPLARDTDLDGVLDKSDKCPYDRGDGADGCPTKGTPAAPAAAKGFVPPLSQTGNDVCTSEPDAVDGFRDDDGCPDEDSDKDGIDNRHDQCPMQAEDFSGLTEGCPTNKAP